MNALYLEEHKSYLYMTSRRSWTKRIPSASPFGMLGVSNCKYMTLFIVYIIDNKMFDIKKKKKFQKGRTLKSG